MPDSHLDDPPPPGTLEPGPGSAEPGVIGARPPLAQNGREAPLRATGLASNIWMVGLGGVAIILLLLFLIVM